MHSLRKYLEKGYRYIHFGMVQVAVKPLVHLGVDAPIYLALRDKRLKRYKTSLIAMIQTNVCNGPIYFNCSPNFSIDLTDPLILDTLVLDIHLKGDEFHALCKNFAVIYRVYFRLMNSQLNTRFNLNPLKNEETILLQVNADQPATYTPKRLAWNEITIPEQHILHNP